MPSTDHLLRRGARHFGRLGYFIPLITLCVFLIAASTAVFVAHETAKTEAQRQASHKVRDRITFVQGAAEEFLELGLQDRLQQLISSFASDSDLIAIHIVDGNDQVLASNRLGDVGLSWRALEQDIDRELVSHVRDTQNLSIRHDETQGILDSYASLCGNIDPNRLRPTRCGFVTYRVDLKPQMQATTLALRRQSLYYLSGMAAVVLVVLGLLHILVARRTQRIVSLLKAFGDGRRSARIEVCRSDEISDLGHSINRLLDQVVEDETEIRDGHERLHALFDNVVDSVIVIDEAGVIESANPATTQIFGYPIEEIIGQDIRMLVPEPDRDQRDRHLENRHGPGEKKRIGTGRQVEARHRSGHCFPVNLAISEMHIHGRRLYTGIMRDISEQVAMTEQINRAYEDLQQAHAELEKVAHTDTLTALYNRRHFDKTLLTETMRSTHQQTPLSVLLLDVDYFKLFNDRYGHPAGDRCLQEIAQVLNEVFMRAGELPARYGGEEFAVILPHCDAGDAMNRADALLKTLWERAIPHAKSRVADRVTVSIGAVTYRPVSIKPVAPERLIKAADEMLYEAKAAGRNQARHTSITQATADGTAA